VVGACSVITLYGFESQKKDEVVRGIADHIKKFWDPRMRKAIFAYIDAGGDGLDPPVREAILHLKEHAGQKGHSTATSFQGT
jgi:formate dehydrogenase subunit delta